MLDHRPSPGNRPGAARPGHPLRVRSVPGSSAPLRPAVQGRRSASAGWGWLLALAAPVACCAVPLLLSAGVFAGLTGAAVGGIAGGLLAAAVVITGLLVWRRHRTGTTTAGGCGCCPPNGSPSPGGDAGRR